MSFGADIALPALVPLFPLPNVVLLPCAVLPLHIFEPRYRVLMADALDGDGLIAMALLKPGWEKCYHKRPPIESCVCVGRITRHQLLADGCYNLLLQGIARGRVVSIDDEKIYRRGKIERITQTDVLEIDLADHRRKLKTLFDDGRLHSTDLTSHLMRLCESSISTADLLDVLAFTLIVDAAIKQELLADGDVLRRATRILELLSQLHPDIPRSAQKRMLGD